MASRKMEIILILFCLCFCLIPCSAGAASTADAKEPISIEKKCSLTLSYGYDGKAVEDVPVNLYKIAGVSSDMQYTLADPFSQTEIDLKGIHFEGKWVAISSTLESYILVNSIETDLTALTDRNGQAQFINLDPGLYLAVSESLIRDDKEYLFQSALITLPGLDEDGLWQYQITASPKSEVLPPLEPDEDMLQFKVVKLWKEQDDQAKRPNSIEVEIFRNGESYEKIILSEDNQWSYIWEAPADGADWMVAELNIPAGYSVTVEERSTAFILTNTLHTEDDIQKDDPKTGDTYNILLYIMLMFASGSILILMGIAGKRGRV